METSRASLVGSGLAVVGGALMAIGTGLAWVGGCGSLKALNAFQMGSHGQGRVDGPLCLGLGIVGIAFAVAILLVRPRMKWLVVVPAIAGVVGLIITLSQGSAIPSHFNCGEQPAKSGLGLYVTLVGSVLSMLALASLVKLTPRGSRSPG